MVLYYTENSLGNVFQGLDTSLQAPFRGGDARGFPGRSGGGAAGDARASQPPPPPPVSECTKGIQKVCGPNMKEKRYKGHSMYENTTSQYVM